MRCLRCAGAPRRPATGSALSLTDLSRHVVPYVPGEPSLHMSSSFATRTCLRRKPNGSALPMLPISGLTDSPLLRPVELLASLFQETFTSELSTAWSPSPLSDITTVATEQFHRRDFHPQDQQLASLHWLPRFTHLLRPAKLLAPLYGSDRLPGRRGLLLPGFQQRSSTRRHRPSPALVCG